MIEETESWRRIGTPPRGGTRGVLSVPGVRLTAMEE